MRVLVTNDDGIFAEGIYSLAKELDKFFEVIVAAPDTERSATGHAITIYKPLRVNKIRFFDTDVDAYSINGTPADCVKLAVDSLLKEKKPDLVVSGINNGPNLGTDVLYSGTVSAAIEASILGIPSIAISMGDRDIVQYSDAAEYTCRIAKEMFKNEVLTDTIININYPTCNKIDIKGAKVTTLGIRKYSNVFIERKDPRGNSYYWTSGTIVEMEQNKESDIAALKNNFVSITPIHYNLTNLDSYERIQDWNVQI